METNHSIMDIITEIITEGLQELCHTNHLHRTHFNVRHVAIELEPNNGTYILTEIIMAIMG